MLTIQSFELDNTTMYALIYEDKFVQIEPTEKLTDIPTKDLAELLLSQPVGSFFTPDATEMQRHRDRLAKKLPSSGLVPSGL